MAMFAAADGNAHSHVGADRRSVQVLRRSDRRGLTVDRRLIYAPLPSLRLPEPVMADLTRRLFVTSCLVSVAAACSRPSAPAALVSGIDLAGMDRNVKPGADFWNYANGTWLRTTDIPADRSATGGGLEAQEETDRNMQQLIDAILQGHPAPDSDEARIANYYNAFLNTQAIDAAGMAPARADLA